jgi:hypothetical protein
MRTHEHFWVALTSAVLSLVPACKGGSESSTGGPAASVAAQAKPAAASGGSLRCGDFFSKTEVTALGLDASLYDEGETQTNPGLGVSCNLGAVSVVIFHGKEYDSIREGAEDAVKKGRTQHREGAAVGSATHWIGVGPYSTMGFLASSKAFAASVTGKDAASIEKVARALDAKME